MRIQYKHQKFQADAAKAVVETPTYMIDQGSRYIQQSFTDDVDFTGWSNQRIVPELNDQLILEHLRKIQRANQIVPSNKLEGRSNGYNLTIEILIEESKIHCARKHFKAISGDNVVYDVVDSYTSLMEKVMK